MKKPIAYYFDESLNRRVPVNEEGNPIIDWGETIPGQKKEIILFVKNESNDRLVIRQPYTSSDELKINDYPSRMFPGEMGMVKLSYEANPEKLESHHGTWGMEIVLG